MDVDSRWYLGQQNNYRKFAHVAFGVGILFVALSIACTLAFIDYTFVTVDNVANDMSGNVNTVLTHANMSLGLYDDAVRGLNLSNVAMDLHVLVEKISNLTDLLNRVAEHFHVNE